VLENDSDPDGDTLSAVKVSDPAHGELVLRENGAFSYRPDPGYVGEDSFIYRASDGKLQSTDTLVKITIQLEDQLPAAVDDRVETQEDTPISIDVLANDRGLGDTPIRILSVSSPPHGATSIEGTQVVYTPDLNYFGEDSFTYTIADSDGDESSAIVTVNILSVDDPPVASPDSFKLKEEETLSLPEPGVLENDSDPEGDALTANLVEAVKHGTLKLNADGSLSYVPDENYYGEDQFTYRATAGGQSSTTVTVTLTIEPVEDLPIAGDDVYEVQFNQLLTLEQPGVLANDSDPDGDLLTAVLDQGPSHGTLVLNADGSLEYTPETGFSGEDSFTYWVEDGKGKSKAATVLLKILPAP
jgi:VCBS repeat-containing protein